MPYPYLLAGVWVRDSYRIFSTGSPLTRAVTPFIHYDGSDTSQAFATHGLSLDSYLVRLKRSSAF